MHQLIDAQKRQLLQHGVKLTQRKRVTLSLLGNGPKKLMHDSLLYASRHAKIPGRGRYLGAQMNDGIDQPLGLGLSRIVHIHCI